MGLGRPWGEREKVQRKVGSKLWKVFKREEGENISKRPPGGSIGLVFTPNNTNPEVVEASLWGRTKDGHAREIKEGGRRSMR